MAIITDEVKKALETTAFTVLVTVDSNAAVHPIILGNGAVAGDTVCFDIHRMVKTQANLAANHNAALACCGQIDGKPAGYRILGTAAPKDGKLVFSAQKAEKC
jgi:hypothetical protein